MLEQGKEIMNVEIALRLNNGNMLTTLKNTDFTNENSKLGKGKTYTDIVENAGYYVDNGKTG